MAGYYKKVLNLNNPERDYLFSWNLPWKNYSSILILEGNILLLFMITNIMVEYVVFILYLKLIVSVKGELL